MTLIDTSKEESYQKLLLSEAFEKCDAAAIEALLKKHPDILAGEDLFNKALDQRKWGIVRVIIKLRPEELEKENAQGLTPLLFFGAQNDTFAVSVLLDCKANINARTRDGQTLLMQISRQGALWNVKSFLQYKPDIHVVDQSGMNATMYALQGGSYQEVLLLLDRGGTIDFNMPAIDIQKTLEDTAEQNKELNQKFLRMAREWERAVATELFRNGLDVPVKVFARPARIARKTRQGVAP